MNYSNNYDDLMARLNAIMGMDSPEKKETKRSYPTYKNAFWENMRTGVPQNALKESSSGGYLVPDSYEERILSKLEEDNILRKVSRVVKTTRDLKIPVTLKEGGATWVKEGELYFEDNTEFGDFDKFWIGDRGSRSIKRLSEKYADSGQVGFIVSERTDATLVIPEAVKVLQTKAE